MMTGRQAKKTVARNTHTATCTAASSKNCVRQGPTVNLVATPDLWSLVEVWRLCVRARSGCRRLAASYRSAYVDRGEERELSEAEPPRCLRRERQRTEPPSRLARAEGQLTLRPVSVGPQWADSQHVCSLHWSTGPARRIHFGGFMTTRERTTGSAVAAARRRIG